MAKSRLQQLTDLGQSVWIDSLSREMLETGELERLIREDSVSGVTSNPSIFQKALAEGDWYDTQLRELASLGDGREIFFRLAENDVRQACDLLRPIHEKTDGLDGYVSIEVDPALAYDSERTYEQAIRFHGEIDRPNLYVKIPATRPGLPAIEDAIAAGRSINITLIFSLQRYAEVVDAYLRGLERRVAGAGDVSQINSVASFFVSRVDGHQGLANSLALKAAGITRNTPDPAGGTIVRGPDGEPTGILKDNAMDLVTKVIPLPSHEEMLAAVRAAMKEAARLGVTSVQDNSPPNALRAYRDLLRAGELTVRINAWQGSHSLGPLQAAGIVGGIGDDWLRIGPVKLFADGSMGSGTAAFFAPYADDPSTSGLLVSGDTALKGLIRLVDAAGFQVAVHAIGDRANALVLDALEEIEKSTSRSAARPRIEHAQVIRAADLPRYRALGAVASIQPSHCISDMRWAEKRIGPVRVHDAYRFRSLLDAGIPVAFGTDWSVEPLDPRIGIYAAVTREFPEGGPKGGWHPEEKLTIEEALDLYTHGSAYAELMEGRKGTLEAGKLADLVVLGADLLAMAKTDPPAILTTGTRDLLLSNTVRVHRKLRQAGVEATLQVFEGQSHAQYYRDVNAPETKEAFDEIAQFFNKHLGTKK